MNEETFKLWCIKADNDLKAGTDELQTEGPATDTVCFHMQQCVEKYLKAFLVYHGREVPRSHNCALILQLCIDIDPAFTTLQKLDPAILTSYAVITRYPDEFYMPTVKECSQAVSIAEQTRQFVRDKTEPRGENS